MTRRILFPGVRVSQILSGALLVLAFSIPTTQPRAQSLQEIMAGSVGRFSEDIFECGRQRKSDKPCGLSFRYYCLGYPSEVNSPALPSNGYAAYREGRGLYMAEGNHTGNFPDAPGPGPDLAPDLGWRS